MKILNVKNLNLVFDLMQGRFQALYNVNFSLNKGEFLAIAGESGSGKTLTAMSILRLLPKTAHITSGEIFFGETDLLRLSQKEMRHFRGGKIALIPQDPMTSLNPLYTVGNRLEEVIAEHRKLKGSAAKKYALEVLDAVKISDAKNRMNAYPHELSGGMKQRIVIATALACNPEIIIADEPTTALDVTVQARIMQLLNEIKTEYETSIIFISHDIPLISENADRTLIMYAGSIMEECRGKDLFFTPKHPYTQALIASLPDNEGKNISGRPPTIKDEFAGCPFEPRCDKALDRCKCRKPKFEPVSETANAACFLYQRGY